MADATGRLEQNRASVNEDLVRLLDEQSKPGYYGAGRLEWDVRDGMIVFVKSMPTRARRVENSKRACGG